MYEQAVPSPSRWDTNHVCRLAQALKRVANITHDLEPDDVAANPLAMFTLQSFAKFVKDVGREEASRRLVAEGFELDEAVDFVTENY